MFQSLVESSVLCASRFIRVFSVFSGPWPSLPARQHLPPPILHAHRIGSLAREDDLLPPFPTNSIRANS
jgi:hypothetical protein